MTFEKFTKTGGRIGTPKASIWSRGQIGLNRGALERFSLDKYKFVMLFYDKENKKVGIKFTNDTTESNLIKIIHRKNGGLSFSGTAFLHYYGINYAETKKYDLEYDKTNDLYVFDLNIDTN
jgi:hypothetical protein